DARGVEAYVAVGGREHEITRVNACGSAFEAEHNLVRVGRWRHPEVVFELSLSAVVNQVDAGINRLILHPGKLRNVMTRLGRIIANKIVALSRQRRSAGHAGR